MKKDIDDKREMSCYHIKLASGHPGHMVQYLAQNMMRDRFIQESVLLEPEPSPGPAYWCARMPRRPRLRLSMKMSANRSLSRNILRSPNTGSARKWTCRSAPGAVQGKVPDKIQ